jgi:hypothetical protein
MLFTPLGISLMQSIAASRGSGGTVAATWDSGNSSTDYTLSGGNLIATRSTVGSGWALVRASPTKASGTVLITINSLGTGGAGSYLGFDLGDELSPQFRLLWMLVMYRR